MALTRLLRSMASAMRPAGGRARPLCGVHTEAAANGGSMLQVTSEKQFRKELAEHHKVVVDCFAAWCGPCKAMEPVVAKLADEAHFRDTVRFVQVDVDAVPRVSQALGVRAMPTFYLFKDGAKVDEVMGANPPALVEVLERLAAA